MSNKKPMILVLAGPNGSGKSTITQFFEKVGTYTNADDIVANIKELMRLCDILHVYDNTIQPIRIIRKHKEELSIFPNENWTEEMIIVLIKWLYLLVCNPRFNKDISLS